MRKKVDETNSETESEEVKKRLPGTRKGTGKTAVAKASEKRASEKRASEKRKTSSKRTVKTSSTKSRQTKGTRSSKGKATVKKSEKVVKKATRKPTIRGTKREEKEVIGSSIEEVKPVTTVEEDILGVVGELREIKKEEEELAAGEGEAKEEEEVFYAYKVVAMEYKYSPEGGSYVYKSPSIGGKLKLEYKVGERTHAIPEMASRGYGVMIFTEIADARRWGGGELFKVRCGPIKDCPTARIHVGTSISYEFSQVNSSWDNIADWIVGRSERLGWPQGSKMTDWVELVEKVKGY